MGDSRNEVGGNAEGPVLQVGAVHGDVHVHHHPARPYLIFCAFALVVVVALVWWPRPERAHAPGPTTAEPTPTSAEPTRTSSAVPRTSRLTPSTTGSGRRPPTTGPEPTLPADTGPPPLPTLR